MFGRYLRAICNASLASSYLPIVLSTLPRFPSAKRPKTREERKKTSFIRLRTKICYQFVCISLCQQTCQFQLKRKRTRTTKNERKVRANFTLLFKSKIVDFACHFYKSFCQRKTFQWKNIEASAERENGERERAREGESIISIFLCHLHRPLRPRLTAFRFILKWIRQMKRKGAERREKSGKN